MDSNLDYIRQQLKSYENNMDNEKGCHHLENALEFAMEVIENRTDRNECSISCNCIYTYLRKTINRATELLGTSPNSKQLCAIYNAMESFIDYGFDNMPKIFWQLKDKVFIEHLHKQLIEVGGAGFSDDIKNKLLQSMNKKKD